MGVRLWHVEMILCDRFFLMDILPLLAVKKGDTQTNLPGI